MIDDDENLHVWKTHLDIVKIHDNALNALPDVLTYHDNHESDYLNDVCDFWMDVND